VIRGRGSQRGSWKDKNRGRTDSQEIFSGSHRVGVYIEAVPNRNSPPAILLRETYRHDGKFHKRTLCNLSHWHAAHIEGLRGVLKGGTVIPAERDAFTVTRSLPHGHVAAALGTARKIGLDRILGPDGNRCRDLVLALLIGRILDPVSKLAAARALSPATASSSLGEVLGLGEVDDDELYAALDWLLARQPAIETVLAKRHLTNGTLVLYDVSSSYMEGRCCPLAKRGYSRDGKKGTLQIVYGLLCAPDGCPVAIEVFDGNTGDPTTLAPQIEKLKQRFGLDHVVLVGDRGMITQARITEDIKSAGLDWITSLRAPAIRELLNSGVPARQQQQCEGKPTRGLNRKHHDHCPTSSERIDPGLDRPDRGGARVRPAASRVSPIHVSPPIGAPAGTRERQRGQRHADNVDEHRDIDPGRGHIAAYQPDRVVQAVALQHRVAQHRDDLVRVGHAYRTSRPVQRLAGRSCRQQVVSDGCEKVNRLVEAVFDGRVAQASQAEHPCPTRGVAQ
jgi:hypothetical protein